LCLLVLRRRRALRQGNDAEQSRGVILQPLQSAPSAPSEPSEPSGSALTCTNVRTAPGRNPGTPDDRHSRHERCGPHGRTDGTDGRCPWCAHSAPRSARARRRIRGLVRRRCFRRQHGRCFTLGTGTNICPSILRTVSRRVLALSTGTPPLSRGVQQPCVENPRSVATAPGTQNSRLRRSRPARFGAALARVERTSTQGLTVAHRVPAHKTRRCPTACLQELL
jgi:hypothetical protein